MKFLWPVKSRTIPAGGRFLDPRGYGQHDALDIVEGYGADLRSAHNAPTTVLFAGRAGDCGRTVWLRDAEGYRTHYCHLSAHLVVTGQMVEANGLIGRVGGSGGTGDYDYGSHCHINLFFAKKPATGPSDYVGWVGMWAVDPELYLGKEEDMDEHTVRVLIEAYIKHDATLFANEVNHLIRAANIPRDQAAAALRAKVDAHVASPHGGTLPPLKVVFPGTTVSIPAVEVDVEAK